MSPWRDLVLLSIWGDTRIQIVKSVPKNLPLSKGLSHQIPWSTEGLPPRWTPSGVTSCSAWGSVSVEADGKRLWCSVVGSALGRCHFVVDTMDRGALQATVQGVTRVGHDLATRSPPICADPVSDMCHYLLRETETQAERTGFSWNQALGKGLILEQERNKLAALHLELLGTFLILVLISIGFSLKWSLLLPLSGFLPRSRLKCKWMK